jgi:hypothetical protein
MQTRSKAVALLEITQEVDLASPGSDDEEVVQVPLSDDESENELEKTQPIPEKPASEQQRSNGPHINRRSVCTDGANILRPTALDFYESQDPSETSPKNEPAKTQPEKLDPRNTSGLDIDICGICLSGWYHTRRKCVQCDKCDIWFHASCAGIKSDSQYKKIAEQDSEWYCYSCQAPNLDLPQNAYPSQMGIVTQTLADLENATSQPEPSSVLSQAIRESRTASSPVCDLHLPEVEKPKRTLSSAKWGVLKGQQIAEIVQSTYDVVVNWRRNLFLVPTGAIGQQFIEEVSKTVNYFTSSSALEEVALTMVMIMPALLLQKPSKKSKTKEHKVYLEKRLKWWVNGDLDLLVREGEAIQDRLAKSKASKDHSEKVFVRLMLQGKVSAALRWIGSQATSVLSADDATIRELVDLHPKGAPATQHGIFEGPIEYVEPVIFDSIDGETIQACAKRTSGSAGPSGLDADGWQRILCSKQFKSKPMELCDSLALLARKLCTRHINPSFLKAFTACRLVPLDKNPGVRPVGIGEVIRRIIGKSLMKCVSTELGLATAPIQVCSGLPGGVEAAVHAVRKLYEDEDTEAVILVDAENAFNLMNRKVALNNIRHTCPPVSTYIINSYRNPASLYVSGADEPLLSEEGVTQGDNSAMGFYACSMMPLIKQLMLKKELSDEEFEYLKQIWYADDAAAGGKLKDIHKWWLKLCEAGPIFGYYPKPAKSWVIAKPGYLDEAKRLFPNLNVTDMGHKYLGSYIGTDEGKNMFVESKVKEWITDIEDISKIAAREPQVAYAAYIYGLSKRWNYVCRTTPNIATPLRKLEFKIQETFIPALLDRVFSCTEKCRNIFALPAREGGLSIYDISETSDTEYQNSCKMTASLTNAIFEQAKEYDEDTEKLKEIKTEISKGRIEYYKQRRAEIYENLSDDEKLQLDLASEKGASSWLTSLPLKNFGFLLNKQEFRDAICLRYNLKLKDTAIKCVCGEPNTINHALICKKGGYVSLRHNSLRDRTAEIMRISCRDVSTEPNLLPINGVQLPPGSNKADNARLDVAARSVWNPLEKAFFDIRVFHAPAPSNKNLKTLKAMYKSHENEKKREYNTRVMQVEKGVFSPLVFSTSGGMGEEAGRVYKRIAQKMAYAKGQKYHDTVSYIRRRLRFDLLKTTIIALRGYRGKPSAVPDIDELDLNLIPEG